MNNKRNYIDAENFKTEVKSFVEKFVYCKKKNKNGVMKLKIIHRPVCQNKLCGFFYDIATHLSSTYKIDYDIKKDMIQRAVRYCIRYSYNCDLDENIFSYYTEICKNAFLQEINSENRQREIFNKLVEKKYYFL